MASNGFYDSDPFGDPFCPPPVPTSTPVTNPFAPPEPLASPLVTSGTPAVKATMLMTPTLAPTPVGNPFEETDVFAASPAIVPQAAVPFPALVVAMAPSPALQLPVTPVLCTSSPVSMSLATPATKPAAFNASEFDPFSPAKKAAALVASAPQPVVVLRPPSAMGAPLPPVSQKGVAPDDDWNIEWKAEEVAPKTPAVVTPTSSETKTTTTVASSTKGAAAVAPPKLPEGILLARVSTRSIFVREWKPAYWVIVNQRLWIYRSKADYSPDHYIKDPFNERIKKCIPLRDSLRVTEMKSKKYPGENRTLHTFGVEDMDEDGGKSLLAKFAAYDMDQVRALREELDSRAFEARHGKLPR